MKHIIFIPGIMGTELYEGGELFNLPTKRWIHWDLRHINRLKLDEISSGYTITPGLPIEYGFSIIKGEIKKFKIYKDIIDSIGSLASDDVKIHLYGYDWRKNLIEDICPDFNELMESFGDEEVIIVAHSMGGLLAKAYIEWSKEYSFQHNITKVITLGTPWKGSPRAFQTLKYGYKPKAYIPSLTVTKQLAQTFPSVFQLLPSEQFCRELLYVSEEGSKLKWAEAINKIYENEQVHIQEGESINKNFYDYISPSWPATIKHLNIVGINHGTLGLITLNKLSKFIHKDINPLDGDGTVPLFSALPNASWSNSEVFYAKASHQGIVLHKEALKLVKSIITNEEVNLEEIVTSYVPKSKWSYTKIDCPVDVYYSNESKELDSPEESITKVYFGDTKYLIHNDESDQTIEIEAYDEGYTQIETVVTENNEVKSTYRFKTIEANPSNKALLKVHFDETHPKSSVLLEHIKDIDNKEVIEVKGIEIPIYETIKEVPVTTKINVTAVGMNEGAHFDEKGIKVKFEVIKNPNVLDTFYRVNSGPWKVFNSELLLESQKELSLGENVIEYYSIDIFGVKEAIKKEIIYIHPPIPKIKLKVNLNYEEKISIDVSSILDGVNNYKFDYKINDKQASDLSGIDPTENNIIEIQVTDVFGRKSPWLRYRVSVKNLIEKIWSLDGFDGTYGDLHQLLDSKDNFIPVFYVGKSPKKYLEKVSQAVKKVIITYDSIEYNIELLPKLELYLHYHSEIINRKDKNVIIKFSIYDADGNQLKNLEPSITYSILPIMDKDQDVKSFVIKGSKKGIYSFNLDISHLTPTAERIKIEIKESSRRKKKLVSKTFKLE